MNYRKATEDEIHEWNERVAIMLESAGLPIDTAKEQLPREIYNTATNQILDRVGKTPGARKAPISGLFS